MLGLLESAGLRNVGSVVVPRFRFRKASTQRTAEGYGVKAVLFTGTKGSTSPSARLG